MRNPVRLVILGTALVGCLSLQGCIAAAAGAGAAGGYEAQKHGYGVQSPVKKDEAGGYKGQSPVTHDESKDERNNPSLRDDDDSSM